jgi:hypothetical protein
MQSACHPVEHHDLGARARNPAKVNKQGLFLLVNMRWCLVQKISFNDFVPLIERMFAANLRAGAKILPSNESHRYESHRYDSRRSRIVRSAGGCMRTIEKIHSPGRPKTDRQSPAASVLQL